MRCIHDVLLAEECAQCNIVDGMYDYTLEQDMLDFESLEEQPGPEDICVEGHAWCWDTHDRERRADEADYLASMDDPRGF